VRVLNAMLDRRNNTKPALESVSRQELAREWGVKPAHLCRLERRGEGPPAYKVGRLIRYNLAEVAEWMKQQQLKR
jgi:predicted DNA-binding transcriptional regulator AlpA